MMLLSRPLDCLSGEDFVFKVAIISLDTSHLQNLLKRREQEYAGGGQHPIAVPPRVFEAIGSPFQHMFLKK
jgi:hypothetical protein